MTASEKRSTGAPASGSAARGRASKSRGSGGSGAGRKTKPSRSRASATSDEDPGGSDEANTPGFEESLAQLEAVVQHLESGDLDLEEALARFEEGVKLSRACAAHLDAAERRIEMLVESSEGLTVRAFDAPIGAASAIDEDLDVEEDVEEEDEEDEAWT